MAGPQEQCFTAGAYETLFGSRYIDHAGVQSHGLPARRAALEHAGGADILSDATPLGSLQVPASGQPILLMADRQTTGGYPKIGDVITADLPLAGQLAPGDWIEFAPCTRDAAVDALQAQRIGRCTGALGSDRCGRAAAARMPSARSACSATRRSRR